MNEERRRQSAGRFGRRRIGAARRNAAGLGRTRLATHRDSERRQAERRQLRRERAAERENLRAEERTRSRITGRMVVLVLVLAVLAVSSASYLRAYLQQRADIEAYQEQIAETQARIDELKREQSRWQDEEFVAQKARERFGYVYPGETPYVVLDGSGEPLGGSELPDPDSVVPKQDPAWYDDLWRSTKLAGNPPTQAPEPPKSHIEDEAGEAE